MTWAIRIQARFYRLSSYFVRMLICRRVRLLNRNGISLVSNNCLAGILYRDTGIRYQTPTVGLYFIGSAYREFIQDIYRDEFLGRDAWNLDLENTTFSNDLSCPVYCLNGVPKIVFLHYRTPGEAVEAWNSRLARLKGRQIKIILSVRDGVADEDAILLSSKFGPLIKLGTNLQNAPGADVCFNHPVYAFAILRSL